jgi:hypothetical protein
MTVAEIDSILKLNQQTVKKRGAAASGSVEHDAAVEPGGRIGTLPASPAPGSCGGERALQLYD